MPEQKILLHVCCAPCASGCLGRLAQEGCKPVLYFCNSNIDTAEEFERRYRAVEKLAGIFQLEVILEPYRHDLYLKHVAGLENEPERGMRCPRCFQFSFSFAAKKARELGLPFTTTLTVSPHKDSEVIRRVGAAFDNFLFFDFKKRDGHKISLAESAKYGLYRQNYCGCEFAKAIARQACPAGS